jgi:hypothetical protein
MKDPIQFSSIWNEKNFDVGKAVLGGNSTVPAAQVGAGVIYVPGLGKVHHRIQGSVIPDGPILHITDPGSRLMWNGGIYTELFNEDPDPADLFRIHLKFAPEIQNLLPDIPLAATHLLHGDWPDEFKASVQADIECIGVLGEQLNAGTTPAAEDLERAEWAREDLEFKLKWYAGSGKSESTFLNYGGPLAIRMPALLDHAGIRIPGVTIGLPAVHPAVSTAVINVTVETKDPGGVPSPGWRVFANAFAYGKTLCGKTKAFGKLSTPTSEVLSVGRYWMWAQKGTLAAPSLAFSIGGSGGSYSIDVDVP